MRLFKFSLLIFLFSFALHSEQVNAQFDNIGQHDNISTKSLRESSISLYSSPESPKPGSTISVSLSAPSIDVDSSNISWFSNEKKVAGGIGVKSVSVTYPEIGKSLTVRAEITELSGDVYTKSISFGAAGVTILWESRTYVPQLYQGKRIHSTGASVIFQAIPNFKDSAGRNISAKDLIYTWKKNGQIITTSSGYGKDFLGFKDEEFSPVGQIEVVVSSRDKSISATDSVSITRTAPRFGFYKYSLLFGTNFGEESKVINGSGEIGVRTVPFFSPVESNKPFVPPLLTWNLSGKLADTKDLPYLIIQNPNSGSATGNLSVKIRNPRYFGEDIPQTIELKFEQ